jgi:hypothetical protein
MYWPTQDAQRDSLPTCGQESDRPATVGRRRRPRGAWGGQRNDISEPPSEYPYTAGIPLCPIGRIHG